MILGASFDTTAENLAFAEAQGLPFSLLSDVDRAVGRTYQTARAAGEQYEQYPRRVAYLIDPTGIIGRAYDVSDVAGFAAHVLDDLAQLQDDPVT